MNITTSRQDFATFVYLVSSSVSLCHVDRSGDIFYYFPQTFRTLKAAASLSHSGSADLLVAAIRARAADSAETYCANRDRSWTSRITPLLQSALPPLLALGGRLFSY